MIEGGFFLCLRRNVACLRALRHPTEKIYKCSLPRFRPVDGQKSGTALRHIATP